MYSEYINDNKKKDIEIKPSKSEKKGFKKNGDIFIYIIVLGIVLAFIGLIVYILISKRGYTNEEIEKKLISKAQDYIKDNNINKEIYLDSKTLEIEVNKDCSAMSGVLYVNNKYYPNMMCKDYKSDLKEFENHDEKMTLNGDSFIVIPEGVTFYDPLYVTEYDVRRFGKVLEQIGVYNIEYFAIENDISVGSLKRKVIVVKNDEEKELYPKITLSGDGEYILDKGKEYKEPGVKALNYNNHSLDVKTYHQINNLVEDNYIVTYEAKDEQGRTSYAIRNVTVKNNGYDINVNISKTPEEKTNKDVEIKLEIEGKSYQKTILPDDTESANKKIVYKVSENNTYKFKIVDNQVKEIIKEVVIDNINKEKPTGTCEAKVGDNIVVTVEITSTNKIAGYNYKIDTHQSDFIEASSYTYDKKEVNSVNVIVKDEYNNEETITCKITNN